MRRRAFVATTAVGLATATTGCSTGLPEDPDYQQCTELFVPRYELPTRGILPSARKEVDSALEDGAHTAVRLRYPDLVSDDTTLWDVDDNRYYAHRVDSGILTEKLIFEESTPTVENAGSLTLSNQTAETVEGSVSIAADDERLVDAEFAVDPAADVLEVAAIANREYAGEPAAAAALPSVAFPDELRDYEVEVVIETVDGEYTETATVSVNPWFEHYWVQISDDGILAGSLWENDTGFFADGPNDSKVGVHWECTQPPSGWPTERD